jgi:hypothetical protein
MNWKGREIIWQWPNLKYNIPELSWKNWGKPRKTSVRIATIGAEIWTRDLPDTKKVFLRLDHNVRLQWWRFTLSEGPTRVGTHLSCLHLMMETDTVSETWRAFSVNTKTIHNAQNSSVSSTIIQHICNILILCSGLMIEAVCSSETLASVSKHIRHNDTEQEYRHRVSQRRYRPRINGSSNREWINQFVILTGRPPRALEASKYPVSYAVLYSDGSVDLDTVHGRGKRIEERKSSIFKID